jgi:hypothetical protein
MTATGEYAVPGLPEHPADTSEPPRAQVVRQAPPDVR